MTTNRDAVLSFAKVEGAGNDFILVDGGDQSVPWTADLIRRLCDRRRGIGADGVLYLHPPEGDLHLVDYWNADGGPAEFCGNGARCVTVYLLGGREGKARFRLGDVPVLGRCGRDGTPAVGIQAPDGGQIDPAAVGASLGAPSGDVERAAAVRAGVPHLVLLAGEGLFAQPAQRWGPPLRFFGAEPSGVNVDLLKKAGGGWRLRTYERGVEGETLACGSGILAAAWALVEGWGLADLPVTITPTGGDPLRVTAEPGGWFLEGPARIVYRGEVRWRDV